ncbi:Excinuclease ABC, C subunit-like [hydrothermal vent metagenome]|uniref:Excinuclease ABC, C subunit-like n=1 Tax=hydrothermal vent metagenome TaxID=652676 RepID=A0A3B1CFJ1_9ZZZZ
MRMRREKVFYIYIMTNPGDTVLYTGMTNDLARRVTEHKSKVVEGFTKTYNITKLIYFERFSRAMEAARRERQIKGWLRKKKISLVESVNPKWADLSGRMI